MFIVLFSLFSIGFAAPVGPNGISVNEVSDSPMEGSIYLQVLQLVEPKLREHMMNQGVPEEAVEEFFKHGFLYPPHNFLIPSEPAYDLDK